MAIRFFYADRSLTFSHKRKFQSFLQTLFTAEAQMLHDLRYVFCSDDYLIKINQSFLSHDDYTDIITFDLTENKDEGITGEIYISVDRVKENADKLRLAFHQEVCRVMIHGALHLCGYKDKKKSEIALMRKTEDHYLRLWDNYVV